MTARTPLRTPPHRGRLHGLRGWARGLWLVLALCTSTCKFEPVARRGKPERMAQAQLRLLRTLDTLGQYALVTESDTAADKYTGIYGWQHDTLCLLPPEYPALMRAITRPQDAKPSTPRLFLALAEHTESADDAAGLLVVDEHCVAHGSYPAIVPSSVQLLTSPTDQRGILFARDAQQALYAIDPARFEGAVRIATDVRASAPTRTDGQRNVDAIWVADGSQLSLRTSVGEVLHTRGRAVSEFSLSADGKRIAYVDGGALMEAASPDFSPHPVIDDACAPHYLGADLALFSPCESESLVVRYGNEGTLTKYPKGVFAALRSHGVELSYARDDADSLTMTARVGDAAPHDISPPFLPNQSFASDDGTIVGLTERGEFGLVEPKNHTFTALFSGVTRVLSQYRGKSHGYAFLIHHDATDELGTLSVLELPARSVRSVATGVPSQQQKGFVMESGRAFPNYPFASPTIAMLADAVAGAPDTTHFTGSLRAELLLGHDESDNLAEGVSTFLLVASPTPGVLYTVDDGEDAGVWYVAL